MEPSVEWETTGHELSQLHSLQQPIT